MASPLPSLSPVVQRPGSSEVVEIGLLLPAAWADGLVTLSKRRGQSVAQLLRGLIERELTQDDRIAQS